MSSKKILSKYFENITLLMRNSKISFILINEFTFCTHFKTTMSDILIKFEKRDIRVLIAYHCKKGLTGDECFNEINSVLGENSVSRATVFNWYREFKHGRTSLEDEPRSGRPLEVTTDDNVAAIEDHVRADPHITHRQLAEILKISTERIQHIMRNILHLRKVSVQWVPHLLTDEQMMTRRRMCEENLKMFSDGGQRIISQILTGDETWVYYYDVPSNREAKIWIFDDEERPKLAQKELHVKKIMYAVFFRSTGLVKSVKLGPRETVTANWYKDICLPQVFEIITNERPATGLRGLILHHDNARPHTAAITREYLEELNIKTMPHPSPL